MTIDFTLNGKPVSSSAQPTSRLSQVLRDEFGLKGNKIGCNAGDCGACTVLVDGDIANACITPVSQLQGRNVSTVEGLAQSGLQQSFLHYGAAQCGICTPGMLIAATALLNKNPKPERQQVEHALSGVLCRCTGYQKIIEAVINASDFDQPAPAPQSGQSVGAPIRHLDGPDKVTGKTAYGADIFPDDTLLVKVIRSPFHHASFTIGETRKWLAQNPGLIAVYTADDIPGKNRFGVLPAFVDQPVFAQDESRFRGEAVAMVVGEADAISALDENDFPIEWRELESVTKPQQALNSAAPQLHNERAGNIIISGFVQRGDTAAGLEVSAHSATVKTSTPFIEHAYIEPEAGYAVRDGDRIIIYAGTQAPHMDREAVADIMGLVQSAVRIIPPACGGGFGSKLDISLQPFIALAAWKLNRPVGLVYTRSESMASTTKRHPSEISLKAGCDADGRITALDFDGTFNTGAYASWGPTVANRVPVHASGPYVIENYRAVAKAVHTHTAPSGAFRGFGVPQSAIAQERAFDILAEKAGIDRLDFRILNALDNGKPTVTGQIFDKGVGIKQCLEALKPAWQKALTEAEKYNTSSADTPYRKGVGIASCWYGCGNTSLPNPSTIKIGITAAGSIVLHQGAQDIGQGANTVITQIAADALGIPVHAIELIGTDTDLTPDGGKTSASRQTYVSGNAALLSGKALRQQILRKANVSDAAIITFDDGKIIVEDGDNSAVIDLSMLEPQSDGYVLMAQETYDPPTSPLDENGQGIPYAVFGYGAQLVELTVDTRLGTINLDHIITAHDVGKAINPLLVEGQIEGGVAQGIGLALMEEFIPGKTENLHDYLIPTTSDMPSFTHHIIEVEDAHGPNGAKGLGEHVLIPTAPAILGAITHATGGVVENLPATPPKVLAAIQRAGGKQ